MLDDTKDVNANASDNSGHTPLSRALENGHSLVSKLLQKDKVTLHFQVQNGNLTLVRLLTKTSYDVNTRDFLGRTPLHIAALFGHLDIARELLDSQAYINLTDTNGPTPLQLALRRKHKLIVLFLLSRSAEVKHVCVEDWLDIFPDRPTDKVLVLTHRALEKDVFFTEAQRSRMVIEPGQGKRLFMFADYSLWSNCMSLHTRKTKQSNKSRLQYHIEPNEKSVSVFVAGCLPVGRDAVQQRELLLSHWHHCGIAWNIVPPTRPKDGPNWRSVDHFSTLEHGWIPDNGGEFFANFMQTLKKGWWDFCLLAEERLSKRRLEQVYARGNKPEMIHCLAEDAQECSTLRTVLRDQVRMTYAFAAEYFYSYDQNDGSVMAAEAIKAFDHAISDQISQLEQMVKDLLQFEFAWVSINEAHRSTSIAKSMKRLSWITFVFLPAMFASSLFGMNVGILKANPDWRWFFVFGGGFLFLTVLGWLFKYGQLEMWVERHIGTRLQRWSGSSTADFV